MKPSSIATVALLGAASLIGCTGGNMGDTRGGGAAPGQSGGRDTAHSAAAPAPTPTPGAATSGAAAPTRVTDTTKRRGKTKQP